MWGLFLVKVQVNSLVMILTAVVLTYPLGRWLRLTNSEAVQAVLAVVALWLIVIVATVWGFAWGLNREDFRASGIIIPPVTGEYGWYGICSTDDDCVRVRGESCDECNCGVYVNTAHSDEYLQRVKAKCSDYQGATCLVDCVATKAKCVERKCVGVAN